MRARRLVGFIVVIQSVLFLTHFLLYQTWTFSPVEGGSHGAFWIKLALGFLSVSFVAASLLAFRYTNALVRGLYRIAAVWVGLLTFLFAATIFSWIIFGVAWLSGLNVNFHRIVEWLFAAAIVAGFYGVFNAELDPHHANHRAAGELAGGLARANRGTHQRSTPGARKKWQFSAPHGGQDSERRTGRNLHRWGFV